MKKFAKGVLGAFALLSLSNMSAFAIEGLQISLQCSNVVLAWPSAEGETYLVQYRPTLNATDSWATVTDYLPATTGTNITFLVHSNVVQNPCCGCGGGSFLAMVSGANRMSLARSAAANVAPVPMAIPADGSGGAVPLALYPPSFDLSGFLIFDPATGETVSGAGYTVQALSPLNAQADGLQPMDGPVPYGGVGDTVQEPETGFYRVVRDGAHLYGLTNDTVFSGVVTIPVELANDAGDLTSLSLTENDAPVGSASILSAPFTGPLQLVMDTTQMANGVHQIVASARWEDTNGGIWEADSPAVEIIITNEISFENWMPSFGELDNSLLIRATSAHPDTDWNIDVYDSSHSYVGSLSGHTYDGDISVAWDLTDGNGIQHTNDNFFTFKISTQYVDPPTPPLFKVTDPWSGPGAWVAVEQHAWDGAYDNDLLYGELSGFIGGALGVNWTVLPPPQGQNQYGSWLAYGLTFGAENPQGDTDWRAFRNALYDSRARNLVYFGHGGPNGIGYNPANTNRFISSAEIESQLHTVPPGQANRHAFRFVFLDGCQTGKGNLPEAFGIIHKENVDLDDYIAASMRPSAFAGWTATKWIDFLDGTYINYDHVTFISAVQTEMLLGSGIHDAIHNAATHWNVVWSFNWINQMAVYGFWDLHFGQYNN